MLTALGTVNQSGGTVSLTGTLATLLLANSGDASSYNLTGGSLSAPLSTLVVGPNGAGSLNISGTTTAATFQGINLVSTGNVTLTSGTLAIGSTGITGSGALSIGTATIQSLGNATISVPVQLGGALTFASGSFGSSITSVISGAGVIDKIGTGSLTLSNNNTFSGGLTVLAGTVASQTISSLGTGTVTEAGGTLSVSGSDPYSLAHSVTFGGSGTGWKINHYFSGETVGVPNITNNDLFLTPPAATVAEETNTAWYTRKADTTMFDTHFTYTEGAGTTGSSGFTFTLQNAASSPDGGAGTAAIGSLTTGLGYAGIGNSFAVAFNIDSTQGNQGIAFETNGAAPGGYIALGNNTPGGTPVSLTDGVPIGVEISYDGTTVTVTLTEGTNVFSLTDTVNIQSLVGGNSAYIGFTGSTNSSPTSAQQDIANFTYTATDAAPPPGYPNAVIVPAGSTATTFVNTAGGAPTSVTMGPVTLGAGSTLNVAGTGSNPISIAGFGGTGSTGWTTNGGPTISSDNNTVTLVNGVNSEDRSLFYNSQVNDTQFHAHYTYLNETPDGADGTAFVLQATGPTALGVGGGAFGVTGSNGPAGGIEPFVAIEFNIFLTGTYTQGFAFDNVSANGTSLTAPQGASTGPNRQYTSVGAVQNALVNANEPIAVDVVYDGTTLTMTLTDADGTYTASETINIASILGTSSAYVGFTGATGGVNSTQTVSNFTYTAPAAATSYSLTFTQANLTGADTVNVANNSSGPGALTLGPVSDGGVPATLNLNPAGSGTVSLTAAGTITNGTVVNVDGGPLNLSAAGALGSLAAVTVATGASVVLGANETLGSLAGVGSVTLNGNTLTDGSTNGLSSTFAGAISDGSAPGSLVAAGSGTLTLTGMNTYTGPTTVSAGSLIIGSTGSLSATSTVSVDAGALLGGSGTVGNLINSGIVNPGVTGAPAALNASGTVTLGPGALVLDLANQTSYDSLVDTGSINITGTTLSLNVGTIATGDTYTILVGGAPATGTFVNLPSTGSTLTIGSVTFTINYAGGTNGDDVILTATGASSPSIVSTVLNGGLSYVNSSLAPTQHSMVENVVYSFSQAVSLSNSNVTLSGINGTTTAPNVILTPSNGNTVWTVTFSGVGVNTATGSIGDGEYALVPQRRGGTGDERIRLLPTLRRRVRHRHGHDAGLLAAGFDLPAHLQRSALPGGSRRRPRRRHQHHRLLPVRRQLPEVVAGAAAAELTNLVQRGPTTSPSRSSFIRKRRRPAYIRATGHS